MSTVLGQLERVRNTDWYMGLDTWLDAPRYASKIYLSSNTPPGVHIYSLRRWTGTPDVILRSPEIAMATLRQIVDIARAAKLIAPTTLNPPLPRVDSTLFFVLCTEMKYRNAFGGIVPQQVPAKYSRVIELFEAGTSPAVCSAITGMYLIEVLQAIYFWSNPFEHDNKSRHRT